MISYIQIFSKGDSPLWAYRDSLKNKINIENKNKNEVRGLVLFIDGHGH